VLALLDFEQKIDFLKPVKINIRDY
jgi:hypothetical protein